MPGTTSEIDTYIDIFSKDIYKPSPTYNDLVLLLQAVKASIGGGSSGAGSNEIIDLGSRLVGSELMDVGKRI